LDAGTVDEAIGQLDASWPGLRDRLCEPGSAIRPHIHFYVDRERAQLDTPLEPRSRGDVIAAISGAWAVRSAVSERRNAESARRCYPLLTTFHRLGEMGARRPFLV